MKKLLLLLLFIPLVSFGQNKKELHKQLSESYMLIEERTNENNLLKEKLEERTNENNLLKEKLRVSFDTPENYAESIFKLLKNKNLTEASKLLFSINDSTQFSNELKNYLKFEAKEDSVTIKEWIQKELNNEAIESFNQTYYDGLNMGIDWQNAVFQKASYKIDLEDEINTYVVDRFLVFFKSSYKDYCFQIKEALIVNDQLYNWRLKGLTDIQAAQQEQEEREKEYEERKKQQELELENKPYTPYGLSVGGANWSYTTGVQRFNEFRVKIINNTEYPVDRVKFQLSIYTGAEYSGGTKSFSKTYNLTYYVPRGVEYGGSERLQLAPGDIQEIQIQELRDFFLGEDIGNQKNWYIKTKVIEVYPKHNEN